MLLPLLLKLGIRGLQVAAAKHDGGDAPLKRHPYNFNVWSQSRLCASHVEAAVGETGHGVIFRDQ